jgi:hypothetical protein
MGRVVLGAFGVLVLIVLVVQLVPYGRAHSNPPVVQEPTWDSVQTQMLFARACADCHSNQTVWPSYSNVAPLSWLAQYGIDGGRAVFNVSEQSRGGHRAGDVAGSVQAGRMPPDVYVALNPEARLTTSEQQTLIQGLRATFGG